MMKPPQRILRPSVIRADEWYKERNQAQWKSIKELVLRRDQYTCSYCRLSCKKFMQVNHIGAEDDHSVDNLETVCAACHRVLHFGASTMRSTMSIFECQREVINMAAIVCITRSLIAKNTSWLDIEQHILARFARPTGKHYTPRESVHLANTVLHAIEPPLFRGYLPEGLAIVFHEEGEWNGFAESIWKWQCLPGSGYRKA